MWKLPARSTQYTPLHRSRGIRLGEEIYENEHWENEKWQKLKCCSYAYDTWEMNARVIPAIGINLARRCKPVLLAQLYYAERELLFCCGVLIAFLDFFVAEGLFAKLNFLLGNR